MIGTRRDTVRQHSSWGYSPPVPEALLPASKLAPEAGPESTSQSGHPHRAGQKITICINAQNAFG
jgi:hypothetical protein